MKICVLGLDCAAPEVVFGDERLVNLRRLMDAGVYGRLESVIPPITVPVPPNYPPRRINGISIGCFLTPDTVKNDFTYPPAFKSKINELVGEYPVDVKNFRTDRKDWLKD